MGGWKPQFVKIGPNLESASCICPARISDSGKAAWATKSSVDNLKSTECI